MNTFVTRVIAAVGWSFLWYGICELLYGIAVALMYDSMLPLRWAPVYVGRAVLLGYGLCGWIWLLRSMLRITGRRVLVIIAALTGVLIVSALLGRWVEDLSIQSGLSNRYTDGFVLNVNWYALGAWLLVTAWIIARAQRSSPGSASVKCPDCGYDMRGLTHTTCPECGKEHRLDALISSSRESRGPSFAPGGRRPPACETGGRGGTWGRRGRGAGPP